MARFRESFRNAASVARERIKSPRQFRELAFAAFMIALISILLIAQLPGTLVGASRDDLIVLIAPFRDPDGQVTQTGRALANRLAQSVAHADRGIVATVLDDAPADANDAVLVLNRSNADLLVWGETTPGALYADEALLPWIAMRPTGQFGPNGWAGYTGRFAIPATYQIAARPISGQTTLEPLIGALADYFQGRDSTAYMTFDALLATRSELLPILPLMVQGNILWARSEYTRATQLYERAVATVDQNSDPRTAALLLNNLGAIRFDAGDARSRDTFNQAITLLADDLGELRFNLGLELLRTSQFAEAVQSLEQARNLLPATAQLELSLAYAYREAGQLDDAQAALRNASRLINLAGSSSLPMQREIVRTHLNAESLEQQGLLNLARLVQARSPLIWEIAAAPTLAEDRLRPILSELDQSWNEGVRLQGLWSRRAASYDAAGDEWSGKIAVAQLQLAKNEQLERTIWRAAINTEIGRAQRENPDRGPGAWLGTLFGNQRASIQARRMLETVVAEHPTNVVALLLYGRTLRIEGDSLEAARQFETAALLAPRRPEPLYGLAVVAQETDPERARQLLNQSLAFDDRFFPAHDLLAQIAERQADWPTAIAQRRWLAANRPGDRATLDLAGVLRRSGPEGMREAEQLLLEPANQGNVDALLELSRLYDSLGQLDAVISTLERAHEFAPTNDLVAYALGDAYQRQGDERRAEELYRTAIDLQRRNIPAILGLASLESTTPERRARLYRDALDAGADDPVMLRTIGDQLVILAEYQSAAEAYQRAIRVTPNDPALHLGLARVYLARGAAREAQEEARRAFDLAGGAYPEALVTLGDAVLQAGDPAAAIAAYNDGLRQNPRMALAHIGLGRAAAAGGSWAVAEGEFRLAIELDPQLAEAQLWLGEALIRQEQTRAAIEAYTRAINLRPRYPEAYFGLAQAQLTLNQLEEGRANLDTAITLRPAYAEAYLLRGKFYERMGDVQKASNAYSMAIESNQNLAEPYFRRALLKIQNNQFDSAETDLETAVRRQPSFVEAQYWLGRVYYARGRYDVAIRAFRQAVELRNGDYVDARFYQGLSEEQLGQRDAAIASFRATLELDRSGEWTTEANAALARLGTR